MDVPWRRLIKSGDAPARHWPASRQVSFLLRAVSAGILRSRANIPIRARLRPHTHSSCSYVHLVTAPAAWVASAVT